MPREVLKRRPKAQTSSKWANDLSASNVGAASAASETATVCADNPPTELKEAIKLNSAMTRAANKAAERESPNADANFLEKIGFRAAATNLVKMHLSVM